MLGFSISTAVALDSPDSGAGGTNRFPAGDRPCGIAVDPTYPYAYVANVLDSTVTAYSISNGALDADRQLRYRPQPVAIGIDPSTNHFLFTANFLGSNVSGLRAEHAPTAPCWNPKASRIPRTLSRRLWPLFPTTALGAALNAMNDLHRPPGATVKVVKTRTGFYNSYGNLNKFPGA